MRKQTNTHCEPLAREPAASEEDVGEKPVQEVPVAVLAGHDAVQVEHNLAPQAYEVVHEGQTLDQTEQPEQVVRLVDADGKAAEDQRRADRWTADGPKDALLPTKLRKRPA